jgi:hypothetical protein
MAASAPSVAHDSSEFVVVPPTMDSATVKPISETTCSTAIVQPSTASSVTERALCLLLISDNKKRLAERAAERVSVPALRARTIFLLTQPKAQADLEQQIGNISLTAVIARPDASEHRIASLLLGLDTFLALSIISARDGAARNFADELGRDAVVGAALADEAQLERLAALLAGHMRADDTVAMRAAEVYVGLVGSGGRVRAAAVAEQAYDAIMRRVAGLKRHKWKVNISSGVLCPMRRV